MFEMIGIERYSDGMLKVQLASHEPGKPMQQNMIRFEIWLPADMGQSLREIEAAANRKAAAFMAANPIDQG
jgi:hypothetical protein